jgi:pimeloyl-ACP methyl ester carboxylesterase
MGEGRRRTRRAWMSKPSWYLQTTDDRILPPETQREMAERIGAKMLAVAASHMVLLSNPEAVAGMIEEAAA